MKKKIISKNKIVYYDKKIAENFFKLKKSNLISSNIQLLILKNSIQIIKEFSENENDLFLLFILEDDPLFSQNNFFWKELTHFNFLIIEVNLIKKQNIEKKIKIFQSYYYKNITWPLNLEEINSLITDAFRFLNILTKNNYLEQIFKKTHWINRRFYKVAHALSKETDYYKLLHLIHKYSKELTDAKSGILYLIEQQGENLFLRLIISDLEMTKDLMLIKNESTLGYVFQTGQPLNFKGSYELPEDIKYCFNLKKNEINNHPIKSLLIIPLVNHEDKVFGILQLINKTIINSLLCSLEDKIFPFTWEDIKISSTFARHAFLAMEAHHSRDRSIEIKKLTKIGKALATERNYNLLIKFILEKSKEITHSDSGSIYLAKTDSKGNKYLLFKASDLSLPKKELRIPMNKKSISGYVATLKKSINLEDVYKIPDNSDYSFNKDFDTKNNYRTKSMIVVPMLNQKNQIIGVLQLINKKRRFESQKNKNLHKEFIPFNEYDIELVESIAGQAAVAIENNILYQDIEKLFEGFVKASITAIESRDPTTSGHSERVAIYTVKIAEMIDNIDQDVWKGIRFSKNQIKEIRYASLLHDFGKVGVREEVLVKAKKLYPEKLDLIKLRFNFIKKTLQEKSSNKKIKYLLKKNREEALYLMQIEDKALKKELEKIDQMLKIIIDANDPLIFEGEINKELANISNLTYLNFEGKIKNYLENHELEYLNLTKGTLTDKERFEIESHVTHTVYFLSQIPWTGELKGIPEIAYAHHEKLNGSGYPRKINSKKIPLQSRIMTVADIYDALVAHDRPYKKAITTTKALDILQTEADNHCIDKYVVDLFIKAKIYNACEK